MSEKAVFKSCVADINLFLQTLIETHDSLHIVSVLQHLDDKLKKIFSMLNSIEGASEPIFRPKKGENPYAEEP